MDLQTRVRQRVREIFQEADEEFVGYAWYFRVHLEPVVDKARELCEKYGGNEQVVVLAAYLHDVGLIGEGKEDHEKRGARVAGEILSELGADEGLVSRVKEAILATGHPPTTLEGRIVRTADALSNFSTQRFVVKAFRVSPEEFYEYALKKVPEAFEKIDFDDEREEIRPVYEVLMVAMRAERSEV